MKKGYLYVILVLAAMWIQYCWFVFMTDWIPYFKTYVFWPLTITLWTFVVTIAFYLSTWRSAT